MNLCTRISSALLAVSIAASVIACSNDSAYSGIVAPNAVAHARGANNLNAKSCQKDGWTRLYASTFRAFLSEQACTSHGAEGGSYMTLELSNGRMLDGLFVIDVRLAGFPEGTQWWGEFGGTTIEMLFDGDGQHSFAVSCPSRSPTVYLTATSPDGSGTIASNSFTIDCPP